MQVTNNIDISILGRLSLGVRDLTQVFGEILRKYTPRKDSFYSLRVTKLAQLFLLEVIEPFPDQKMIKLLTHR